MEFNPSGYRGDPGIPHSDTKTFGYLLACSNVSLGEHNMAKEAALLRSFLSASFFLPSSLTFPFSVCPGPVATDRPLLELAAGPVPRAHGHEAVPRRHRGQDVELGEHRAAPGRSAGHFEG